jgi:hypothetical protein
MIKNTTAFVPLRFAETLKALYISATSHIVSKKVKINNDIAITKLPVEKLIDSPFCKSVQSIYFPNLLIESENPIKEAIKYGTRARACVPNISTNRIEDGDPTIANKYNRDEKTIQFERLCITKYQTGKSGHVFIDIKSGKCVLLV